MAASKHPFYHPKVWVEAVAAAIVIIAVGVGLFVDPPAAPVDNAEPTAAVEIMNLDLLSDPQFLGTERFSYDQVFPGSAEMTLPTFNFNGQETEEGGLS